MEKRNYVEQLPDRQRRRCRRPSGSPPSRARRGQWLDPGRTESRRRHRMLRRTRLLHDSQESLVIHSVWKRMAARTLYTIWPASSLIHDDNNNNNKRTKHSNDNGFSFINRTEASVLLLSSSIYIYTHLCRRECRTGCWRRCTRRSGTSGSRPRRSPCCHRRMW